MLQDVATEVTIGERNVNLITGILGNVSGSQWLSETIINVSGEDGHSNGQALINGDIIVKPSFSTGRLVWNGEETSTVKQLQMLLLNYPLHGIKFRWNQSCWRPQQEV